jgi:ferric-dicitrate binding protein FerR (iron transport regulator)
LVIILLNIVPGKNNQTIKVATDTEKNSITLNDGSRVWLNRNTKVTVDQRNDKIRLTGEAYFEFTGETQYQIKTQHGNFTAKLADFNLSSRKKSQRATLAVTNGKVTAIWNKEKELKSTVTSGMQADIVPNIILAISPLEDPNYLAWKTGRLNFENTPLFYVVKKLEKLNNIQIKIENKTLRYCRMNSEFHSTDVKEVLNEIPNYLDCKVLKKGNKYIIKGKGCNHNDM